MEILPDCHRTGGRRQAGKVKSVTTVPAVALAEAEQLTNIVRVRFCNKLLRQKVVYKENIKII